MDKQAYHKFITGSGQATLDNIETKLREGWYDQMTLEIAQKIAYEDFIHMPLYRKLGPTYYKTAKQDLEDYVADHYTSILVGGLTWKNH